MRNEIHKQLTQLINLPLSLMFRYAGCQRFQFGERFTTKSPKGKNIIVSDWALLVASEWEISLNKDIILSSNDFLQEKLPNNENQKSFYDGLKDYSHKVLEIHTENSTIFSLKFNTEYILKVNNSIIADSNFTPDILNIRRQILSPGELWRFMPEYTTKNKDKNHFVVTLNGIEYDWPEKLSKD
jgi:hypothetical protein